MAKYTIYTAEYEPQKFMEEFCDRFADRVIRIELVDAKHATLVYEDEGFENERLLKGENE